MAAATCCMWLFLDCGWNDVLDVASGQVPEVSDASNGGVEAPFELGWNKIRTNIKHCSTNESIKNVKNESSLCWNSKMMVACYMWKIDGLILWISIITILSPYSMLTPFSSTRGRRPVCTAGGSSTRSFCALLHRTDSTNRLLTTVGDVEICHEIQAMFLFPVVKVSSKHQDALKK